MCNFELRWVCVKNEVADVGPTAFETTTTTRNEFLWLLGKVIDRLLQLSHLTVSRTELCCMSLIDMRISEAVEIGASKS